MTSSVKKKFIDLVESMLEALTPEDEPELENLLKPLRVYIHDVERFATAKIIDAKFRAFIKTRDERLLDIGGQDDGVSSELERTQKAINLILDQVLRLLENGLATSEDLSVDLKEVMQKVYEAKTINNVRALSQSFIDLGEKMISRTENFQTGLSSLAVELSFCKNQIQDLENQLEASRLEAERDHLTGVRNRRVFEDDLAVTVDRAKRFRGELCLLILDIDHFREINDQWGSKVGDDVLINFGKLLGRSLREFDLTYRLGGDEFAVLFSGCPVDKAYMVATRVCEYVSSHDYHMGKADFKMTMSGGVASLHKDEDEQSFFERANQQLKRAKQFGGNRVCCAEKEED